MTKTKKKIPKNNGKGSTKDPASKKAKDPASKKAKDPASKKAKDPASKKADDKAKDSKADNSKNVKDFVQDFEDKVNALFKSEFLSHGRPVPPVLKLIVGFMIKEARNLNR